MSDAHIVEPWRQALVAAERRAQRAEAVVEAARRAAKSLRSLEYAPALHGGRARSALASALAAYDQEQSE